MEDIARQAGVSRSTVSRVINNHPHVSDDVRKRVLETIQSTSFYPNLTARALASQRSSMLGLLLPRNVSSFFADPFFPRLTQGIAQACNQFNNTLGLFLITSAEDEEKIFPRVSRKGMLDGILVQSGQYGDQLIERLMGSEMPLVVIGRPFYKEDVSYIDVDNVNAAYTAVSHLIRLGRRRIATIAGAANSSVSIDRLEGYRLALNEKSLPVDPSLMVEGDFTEVSGYYAMRNLMPAKPDAVFVAADLMAIGAMRAAHEAGLSIPDDIAFIGFDDLPLAAYSTPPLTTVRQPIYQLGFNAVEILLEQIKNGILPARRVILNTELIIRSSCGTTHRKGLNI